MSGGGMFAGLMGGSGGSGLSDLPKKFDDLNKIIIEMAIIMSGLKDSVISLEETMSNLTLSVDELVETMKSEKPNT